MAPDDANLPLWAQINVKDAQIRDMAIVSSGIAFNLCTLVSPSPLFGAVKIR